MSDKLIEIMYVGLKDKKEDNVNAGARNRVWIGLGDIQKVTPMEAVALKAHKDIWMDVTQLDDKARSKIIEAVRDEIRGKRRAMQTLGVLLRDASEEEIREELKRRQALKGKRVVPEVTEASPQVRRHSEGEALDGEAASRPDTQAEVVLAIADAINALDPDKEEYFDQDGNPTQEAVQSILHYKVSKSELQQGIKARAQ